MTPPDDSVPPAGRVLFVPVSGPRGMGEYARSLALATAVRARRPQIDIHFVVSQAAPYAADTPFPTTRLPRSPTFHTVEMVELIQQLRPTLVVFDNAGRTAQLHAASKCGARIIYISSRPRQRRKAFRLRWMRVLDEHWIAYPEFIAGGLGIAERLKLRLPHAPRVRFLDAVLPPADAALAAQMMSKFDVRPEGYVLVVPGGGTDHPGAEDAPHTVAQAAHRIAEAGHPTVLVGVPPPAQSTNLRPAPRMPMAQLAELIRGARVVISNGGDTLLQVIACARPCVAVPIAGDQPHRISQCERAGLAAGARLDAADIARTALSLLAEGPAREQLLRRLKSSSVANAMDTAVSTIERLAARSAV
ncbi:MAG: hypothetical protein IRZ28_14930 [Steroidobacteraceae bacterium]|nr:hypothetical protein [Steroidobacteraceae bacterium]